MWLNKPQHIRDNDIITMSMSEEEKVRIMTDALAVQSQSVQAEAQGLLPPSFRGASVNLNGNRYGVHVFPEHPIIGAGLRSGKRIPHGAFFIRFTGKLITSEEEEEMQKQRLEHGLDATYTMVNPCPSDPMRSRIDPTTYGSDARFVNHSHEPNAQFVPSGDPDEIWGQAVRDILPGETINFDYGFQISEHGCLCNAPSCPHPAAQ